MSAAELAPYLERELAPVDPELLEAVTRGPIDRSQALSLGELDRLLDPTPATAETGWCMLADGVAYVAVRTEMPGVSAEMVDWWFDWHPREATRYRVWHPLAHFDNRLERPRRRGAKAHWGAVHHPVEDLGIGVVHARICFRAPSELGMSSDALELDGVGTIVCGEVGDDRMHMRHSLMFHVFLRDPLGLVLRSRFWLGARIRPYGLLARPGALLLDNRVARRAAIPAAAPPALARHCLEEYANLAVLLPELYERFGPPRSGTPTSGTP